MDSNKLANDRMIAIGTLEKQLADAKQTIVAKNQAHSDLKETYEQTLRQHNLENEQVRTLRGQAEAKFTDAQEKIKSVSIREQTLQKDVSALAKDRELLTN